MDDNLFYTISWKIIDKYFEENKLALVSHHIDSYNDFFDKGIKQIFMETNPIQIRKNYDKKLDVSKRSTSEKYDVFNDSSL